MADEITVGGITVPITHPDKVLFPADGITKADLARYYADAAESMLPWLRDRPITMVRYPDGLDGQGFFQKNAPSYFPDWIRRVRVGTAGGEVGGPARGARALLDGELGLTSFARTTGGRGLHVHVGLNRRADFEQVRD